MALNWADEEPRTLKLADGDDLVVSLDDLLSISLPKHWTSDLVNQAATLCEAPITLVLEHQTWQNGAVEDFTELGGFQSVLKSGSALDHLSIDDLQTFQEGFKLTTPSRDPVAVTRAGNSMSFTPSGSTLAISASETMRQGSYLIALKLVREDLDEEGQHTSQVLASLSICAEIKNPHKSCTLPSSSQISVGIQEALQDRKTVKRELQASLGWTAEHQTINYCSNPKSEPTYVDFSAILNANGMNSPPADFGDAICIHVRDIASTSAMSSNDNYLFWWGFILGESGCCTSETKYFTPSGSHCQDTDYGVADVDGDKCNVYTSYPPYCNFYDYHDFTASSMCCACGGGIDVDEYTAQYSYSTPDTGLDALIGKYKLGPESVGTTWHVTFSYHTSWQCTNANEGVTPQWSFTVQESCDDSAVLNPWSFSDEDQICTVSDDHRWIDFCSVANANGIICPPVEADRNLCVQVKSTNEPGGITDADTYPFWMMYIRGILNAPAVYEGDSAVYFSQADVDADTTNIWYKGSNASNSDKVGNYVSTQSDVGKWYVTFSLSSDWRCTDSTVGIAPQWEMENISLQTCPQSPFRTQWNTEDSQEPYNVCPEEEAQYIDFCELANANGIICPMTNTDVKTIICIHASETRDIGPHAENENLPFWLIMIYYSTNYKMKVYRTKTDFDGHDRELTTGIEDLGKYLLRKEDLGTHHLTFTTKTYTGSSENACSTLNTGVQPQWQFEVTSNDCAYQYCPYAEQSYIDVLALANDQGVTIPNGGNLCIFASDSPDAGPINPAGNYPFQLLVMGNSGTCQSTDNGARGIHDVNCAYFQTWPERCGQAHDDSDFQKLTMCCECGGGYTNQSGTYWKTRMSDAEWLGSDTEADFGKYFLDSESIGDWYFTFTTSNERDSCSNDGIAPQTNVSIVSTSCPVSQEYDGGCQENSSPTKLLLPESMNFLRGQASPTTGSFMLDLENDANGRCSYTVTSNFAPVTIQQISRNRAYLLVLDADEASDGTHEVIITVTSSDNASNSWDYTIPISILAEPENNCSGICTPSSLPTEYPTFKEYMFDWTLAHGLDNIEETWYVPFKFYQCTSLKQKGINIQGYGSTLGGFEVTFSPKEGFEGFPTITKTFGNFQVGSLRDFNSDQGIPLLSLWINNSGGIQQIATGSHFEFQYDFQSDQETLIGFKVITGPSSNGFTLIRQLAPITAVPGCSIAALTIVLPLSMTYNIGQSDATVETYNMNVYQQFSAICAFTITSDTPSILTTSTGENSYDLSLDASNYTEVEELNIVLTISIEEFPDILKWVYEIPVQIVSPELGTCPTDSCTPETVEVPVPQVLQSSISNYWKENRMITWYVPYSNYQMTRLTIWRQQVENLVIVTGFEVQFDPHDSFSGWPSIVQLFGEKDNSSGVEAQFTKDVQTIVLVQDYTGVRDLTDNRGFGGFQFDGVEQDLEITMSNSENEGDFNGYDLQTIELPNRLIGFQVLVGPLYDYSSTIRQVAPIIETSEAWKCSLATPKVVTPSVMSYVIGQGAPTTGSYYFEMTEPWGETCSFTVTSDSPDLLTVTVNADATEMELSFETDNSSLAGSLDVQFTLELTDFPGNPWLYTIPIVIHASNTSMACPDVLGCSPTTLLPTNPIVLEMTVGDILVGVNSQIDFIVPFKFYKVSRFEAWNDANLECMGIEVTFEPPSHFTGWEPITQLFGTKPDDITTASESVTHEMTTGLAGMTAVWNLVGRAKKLDSLYIREFRSDDIAYIPHPHLSNEMHVGVDWDKQDYDMKAKNLIGFKAIVGRNYDDTMTTIRQIAPIVEDEGCEGAKLTISIPDRLFYTIGQGASSTSEHYITMTTASLNCEFTMTTSQAYLTATTEAFDPDVGVTSYQLDLETTQSTLAGEHTVELTLTVVGFEDYIWFNYNIPVTIYATDPYPNACTAGGCTPATLEKTVPELQSMTTGDIWDDNTDVFWHVPYKYYRLTKFKTWQDASNQQLSGFEVTYEPPSGFMGWSPFTQMFGTTEFGTSEEISVDTEIKTMSLSRMEKSESKSFIGFKLSAWDEELVVGAAVCVNQEPNGNWCNAIENHWYDMSACENAINYVGNNVQPCCICKETQITIDQEYTFSNQRLIGFKAIVGPEKDASSITIRQIAPIFDTVGCETAGKKWSILAQPLIRYSLISQQVTHRSNIIELKVQKPFFDDPNDYESNDCGYTISSEDPSLTMTKVADQEISFLHTAPADIPVDESEYSISFTVALTIEPLITWTQNLNVLIVEFDPVAPPPTVALFCSSAEPWKSTPSFNLCHVASSLGFTCPPVDPTKVLCFQINEFLQRITTTTYEHPGGGNDGNWYENQFYYGDGSRKPYSGWAPIYLWKFAETNKDECSFAALPSSYQFEADFIDDCTDYSLEKLPPLDTVLHTVPETGEFKTGNLGAEFVEDDWSVDLKNYKLSRIRMWKDDSKVSGFEVTFEAEPGSEGYEPIRHMYGSSAIISMQDFESKSLLDDLSEDVISLSIMMDDSGSDTDLIALKTQSNGSRMINMVAQAVDQTGTWQNYEINTRLIGFHVKIGKADAPGGTDGGTDGGNIDGGTGRLLDGGTTDEIDTIRSIAPIYDRTRCETAVFTLHDIQTTPFILGSAANSNTVIVTLQTDLGENCASHLPDTIKIINSEDPTDSSIEAAFGSLVLLDDQVSQKKYLLTVNTASDASLGTHQLAIQVDAEIYAGLPPIQLTSESFQVEVICEISDSENYPVTEGGAKCPGDYNFCAHNYRTDYDGVGCTPFDNCDETNDGTGGTDIFSNTCPADYIDTSCEDGWQYNLDYDLCPGYTADSSSALEPCEINGQTYENYPQLCPTQYYGVCVGQEVAIPFGFYAQQFYSDFFQGSTSDYFIRLQTGALFGNVGIKSMSEFIEYGDPSTLKNSRDGGSLHQWPGQLQQGFFGFTVEARHIGTASVTFTKCENAAWDTSTGSNDESVQCSAETFSVDIKLTDACTGLKLDWEGQVKYPLDKSMMASYYLVDIKHLFSSLSPNQVTPGLRVFLDGNVSNDKALGYSRGASRFKAEFAEYTDIDGNSVQQGQPSADFTDLGFDTVAFTHINNNPNFIKQNNDQLQINTMYEKATGESTTCQDTDNGALNVLGNGGCEAMTIHPADCGNYGDDDFDSLVMCCACNGGSTVEYAQTIIPTGYYKAIISLKSYIYKDRSHISNENSVDVFIQNIYFYVCEECDTWTLVIDAPDPVEPEPEPEIIDSDALADLLFEEAKAEFESQYPLIQFMMADEELVIEVTMITNPDYSDTMELEGSFSTADRFTEFEAESGEIIISPDISKVGTYKLEMILTDGRNEHMKTMNLQVIEPISEEEAEPEAAAEEEEEEEEEDDVLAVETVQPAREYFIQADPSDLTLNIGEPLVLDAMKYLTKDIGTTFDKIELLGLSDFTQCNGARMVISPILKNQAGEYPFVVRAVDDQNRPQNKQYQIIVVDPTAEAEPVQEEEEVQEDAEDEAEAEADETSQAMADDEEQAADEGPAEPACDEQCKKDAAAAELEEALANAVTETKVEIAGLEINIPLNQLSGGSNEEGGSAIGDIMSSVADLPLDVQEAVFDCVLQEKQKYQEQQREIVALTAQSQGFTPPEPVPPALAFENVDPSGSFGLYFNAGVSGLSFLESLNKGLSARGVVDDNGMGRRLSDHVRGGQRRLEGNEDFNLSNFLVFGIKRGGEDSAEVDDLGFDVESGGLENNLLKFQLKFDNPLAVSMGSEKDMMVATIIDGQFFSSDENGLPIEPGTQIQQLLPKMLPGEEFAAAMQTTKSTVENTTNTFVIAQILITLALAISLKSMWNLMNVIQVLAYVRFFTGWPAFMLQIFVYMDNAITMKPLSDPIFEYGQSQFERANATLSDESMKNMGVQDTQLVKSLGLFAVTFFGLIFLVLVYQVVKQSTTKSGLIYKTKLKLKKKLVYSSFLRYMIVSNLKLNFTIWAFLVSQGSFETFMKGGTTCLYILQLFALCVYPVFIMKFMVENQKQLQKRRVKQKWETLYQGIHTHKLDALLYNAVFCVRRFNIVFINMFFSPGFPLSNFNANQYLFKNFAFIFVQSAYGLYVWNAQPHTSNVFNKLEIFNEGMIIIMCYIMVVYTGVGNAKFIMESQIPIFLSLAVTVAIVFANFGVMIRMTFVKLKQKLAARAEKKALEAQNEHKKNYKAKDLIKPGLAYATWRQQPASPLTLVEEEKSEDVSQRDDDIHVESYEDTVAQDIQNKVNAIFELTPEEREAEKRRKKKNLKMLKRARAQEQREEREAARQAANAVPKFTGLTREVRDKFKLYPSLQQVEIELYERRKAAQLNIKRADVVIQVFQPQEDEENAYSPSQDNGSPSRLKPETNSDVMSWPYDTNMTYSEWNKQNNGQDELF